MWPSFVRIRQEGGELDFCLKISYLANPLPNSYIVTDYNHR